MGMIDWDRVKELRSEIGADDFAEVVDMFLDEANDAVSRLSPTLTARAVEADLHYLKGAALNLGFVALSALCQEGERRAAAGHTDVDVAAVCAVYHDSKIAFESGLSAGLAA